jgi:hypothetical protein
MVRFARRGQPRHRPEGVGRGPKSKNPGSLLPGCRATKDNPLNDLQRCCAPFCAMRFPPGRGDIVGDCDSLPEGDPPFQASRRANSVGRP